MLQRAPDATPHFGSCLGRWRSTKATARPARRRLLHRNTLGGLYKICYSYSTVVISTIIVTMSVIYPAGTKLFVLRTFDSGIYKSMYTDSVILVLYMEVFLNLCVLSA